MFFLVLAAVVCVAVMYPALTADAMLGGHDAAVHMLWQEHFSAVFWRDTVYPRWLHEHNLGFGSPAFFAYPPLSQIMTSLFAPFGSEVIGPAARLALSATLARIIGAWGIYWWMRSHTGRFPAFAAAVVYIVAPYHLAIDTYVRAAFAELWAFAWPPFALVAIDRLHRRAAWPLVLLVAAMTAILLTQAPSVLIVIPALAFYAVIRSVTNRDAVPVVLFTIAGVLSLMLAAPYLVTMIAHLRYVGTDCLYNDYFSSPRWLIGRFPWPNGVIETPFVLTVGTQAGLAAAALAAGLAGTRRRPPVYVVFAVVLLVASIVLTTTVSAAFWELNTPLNRIQFPWRILMLQVLALAPLVAFALAAPGTLAHRMGSSDRSERAPDRQSQSNRRSSSIGGCSLANRKPWRLIVLAVIALGVVILGVVNYVILRDLAILPVRPANTTKERAQALTSGNLEACEYRLGHLAEMAARFPGSARAIIVEGEGIVHVPYWKSRRIILVTESATEIVVAFRQVDYTGWRYRISNGDTGFTQRFSDDEPFATMRVPAGRHMIEAVLVAGGAEWTGWATAAAGLLLTLSVAGGLWWRGRRNARRISPPA